MKYKTHTLGRTCWKNRDTKEVEKVQKFCFCYVQHKDVRVQRNTQLSPAECVKLKVHSFLSGAATDNKTRNGCWTITMNRCGFRWRLNGSQTTSKNVFASVFSAFDSQVLNDILLNKGAKFIRSCSNSSQRWWVKVDAFSSHQVFKHLHCSRGLKSSQNEVGF